MSKGMNIATALEQLGLDNTATAAEVKQAYKDLARIWHPDRFQNDERLGARTEAQIKLINEARTVAMTYLDKYGHFRFVGREKARGPQGQAKHNSPPREKQAPPRQKQSPPRPKKESAKKEEAPRKQEAPRQKEPPKRKPKPKPRPEPEPVQTFQRDNEPGFQMDQGNLVVIFIILLLVSFLFMLGNSLMDSPEDKIKELTQKLEVTNQKSELRKKWEERLAKEAEEKAAEEKAEQLLSESTIIDTFFTLGSDKFWVSEVQGPPHHISGGEWYYGHSVVRFLESQVVGWSSSKYDPLRTGMVVDSVWFFPNDSFKVGSFFQEIIALQGTPSGIDGKRWFYGEAYVDFDSGLVVSWGNDLQNILQAR